MRIKQIIILALGVLFFQQAKAQRKVMNMPEHDQKAYYFGITFGTNFSTYRIKHSQSFINNDTFKYIQPGYGPGFNLGLMGNLRLNDLIDLRFVPSLAFAEKKVGLSVRDIAGNDSISNRTVESIYMHMPLQLKFKSDRIKNFRFYGLTGFKFDYDMAANARSRRKDEFIKVSAADFGAELGVGFEFYYPNFIFSPEIKISQGLGNQIYHDGSIPLSNAIDALSTRMIVISIHLEG
ncbi:MAG: PorT family protein [Chitinophagales bacterium]|nr:PorT family protein [Chitinophagales bacterium]